MSFKLVGMGSVEFLPGHNAVRFLQSLSADGILAHNIVASEEMDVTGSSVSMMNCLSIATHIPEILYCFSNANVLLFISYKFVKGFLAITF